MIHNKEIDGTFIILNGEEIECLNLLRADSLYTKYSKDPKNKIALICNNLIYRSNYIVKGFYE